MTKEYNVFVNASLIKRCVFFGHREILNKIEVERNLRLIIRELIKEKNYKIFYFGGLGEFDLLCYNVVTEFKGEFPQIKRIFCVCDEKHLQYSKRPKWLKKQEYEEFVYLPLRFDYWYTRIYYRNCEMINLSDFIVFYVDSENDGGAHKTMKYANKRKKEYINIAKIKTTVVD